MHSNDRARPRLAPLLLASAALAHANPALAQTGTCPVDFSLPPAPAYSADLSIEPGSTELRADDATLVKDGLSVFTGHVEVIQPDGQVAAEYLSYDEPNELIRFKDAARLWNEELTWQGEAGTLDMASDTATLENGRYTLADSAGRGDARLIERDNGKQLSNLLGVSYTTCAGDNPAWSLSASRIHLDHPADIGSARHVVLRAYGMPVLYVPYLSFPLSDARKTGFLVPTFRNSSQAGFDLQVPFYWNIAPNYDATITPRTLTDRGGALGTEFRYLQPNFKGQLQAEVLPDDRLYQDDTRYLVRFEHQHSLFRGRGRLTADFNQVSDPNYFEDLGTTLGVSSQRFLNRNFDFSYAQNGYGLTAVVRNYQTIDPTIPGNQRPYRLLPQVTLTKSLRGGNNRLNAFVLTQGTYFERLDTVTAGRMHIEPVISYPLRDAGRYVVPSLKLRGTKYWLQDNNFSNENQPGRLVPSLSLDSGLVAEKRFTAFGENLLHTIEPRLYYLYTPKVDQNEIPVFDSGLLDFTFLNLFSDNRFTGFDRIGDTNQLTAAVTTRLIDRDTGRERLRASIGQIYYFENREIVLPGTLAETDGASELVGELAGTISNSWRARSTVQYDPNEGTAEKLALDLNYRPNNGTVLNMGYRRRLSVANIEQTDLSFQFPISENWSALGRWNYSLDTDRTLELVGGLEYDNCCWGLRIGGRRFLRNTQGQFDNAFFVQIHLKGLAGVGTADKDFLQQQIPGYNARF